MDVIEYIADRLASPLDEAIDKACDCPELALELKQKLGSIAPLSLWKIYRQYLLEETALNKQMTENYDMVKLCYN